MAESYYAFDFIFWRCDILAVLPPRHTERGIAASERMGEVLLLAPQVSDRDGALELKGFSDSIIFENVSFGYGNSPVLQNVSFRIPKGKATQIIIAHRFSTIEDADHFKPRFGS